MMIEEAASSERTMTPDLVITGEAVALEVRPTTAGVRILSAVVDYGLYYIGMFVCITTWATLSPSTVSNAMALAELSVTILFWTLLVPLGVELASHGRSAGRLVTGTRVVRDDGGAVRLRQCLVRALVGVVEVWITLGAVAICSCAVTRRGKRLGDLMAGTYLVHDRAADRAAPPVLMPPELAPWAAQADVRALPGDLALIVRSFLQRGSSMRPQPRVRLAFQLAAQVEPYVAPAPPPGTNPERFLAAVLAERRNREFFLEMRDRHEDDAWLRSVGAAGAPR